MKHTPEPVSRLVSRNGVNSPCENSLSLSPPLSVAGNTSEGDEGHTEATDAATCPQIFTSRSAELGYMNLNSSQSH